MQRSNQTVCHLGTQELQYEAAFMLQQLFSNGERVTGEKEVKGQHLRKVRSVSCKVKKTTTVKICRIMNMLILDVYVCYPLSNVCALILLGSF